ncbi:uncharacterized protein Bfra_007412 [Botrytis fragariae]|uniref:Uncharacterized protein n=1 Tax=Botrytis fragariae TaxID=1964551 RepID=A0A8H6EDS9_9HELO|nr:uncharacterized protein Bfra_007412 [Botrytis fragariae]KAF5868215.1 hypothetical protein Bfra_007412 [Botrytis fragariae]
MSIMIIVVPSLRIKDSSQITRLINFYNLHLYFHHSYSIHNITTITITNAPRPNQRSRKPLQSLKSQRPNPSLQPSRQHMKHASPDLRIENDARKNEYNCIIEAPNDKKNEQKAKANHEAIDETADQ